MRAKFTLVNLTHQAMCWHLLVKTRAFFFGPMSFKTVGILLVSRDTKAQYWTLNGKIGNNTANLSHILTASTDKTLILWDPSSLDIVTKFKNHDGILNACDLHNRQLASVSDDHYVRIYDSRMKHSIKNFIMDEPLTGIVFASDDKVLVSGVSGTIFVIDLKADVIEQALKGHLDVVTGLDYRDEFLLSFSIDQSLRLWNMHDGSSKMFTGCMGDLERNLIKPSFSNFGLVGCGSGDHTVCLWDAESTELIYRLPGHKGTVTQTVFHPHEPVVVSCSTDRQILLSEFFKDPIN